jgi:hypothetical protein
VLSFKDDIEAYLNCLGSDNYLFNKLSVARRLGHVAGPPGVPVPRPGTYIVRPVLNLLGMGLGAHRRYLSHSTDEVPPGYFWCEEFKGRHLSVDYSSGKQILCVEGFKDAGTLSRWSKWQKVDDQIRPCPLVADLLNRYETVNVEMIGGRIIEIHLRGNPDFADHDSSYVRPVWKGEALYVYPDEEFIAAPDGERLGFVISKRDNINK